MKSRFMREASAASTLLFALLATALAQTNQSVNPQAGDAAGPAKPAGKASSAKPAWLTEVSLAFREGYDNNVYASGVARKYYPGTYTGPYPGSVATCKDHGSFFETFSPKVAVDLAKLQDDESILKLLSFSYAMDVVNYDDASTENYIAHRLASAIVAKGDDLSFQLDEAFTCIDGDRYGPTYPGKYYNTYGQGIARERRDQWQDRATATLTYDQEDWFLRPTASLLDYDLNTKELAVKTANAGYLNYADRYDVNGGADLGYKVAKDFAVTLGYRIGCQYQQKYSYAVDHYGQSASSDYQRGLLGFEGKPVSWLTVKFQAGPDFRNYNSNAPVRDRNPVTFYGEGSLTAKASADDTIALSYRRWRWVSSTGISPDDENNIDLSYKHRFTDQWSAKLGARAQNSDYSCGESWSSAPGNHSPATAMTYYKNDCLYTLSAGVQYAVTKNISLDVAYSAFLGRNAQDHADLAKASQLPGLKRRFDDQIVSLGAQYKF